MIRIFLVILILAGCTSSPGIIPVGSDTYAILISGQSGFVPVGGMKADAYEGAQKHCKSLKKSLEEVSFNSNSGFGKFPEVELKFKCV
mgnify:CR=1 FL=1|jgi:hypothetical protein|tara:strand:- start:22 stop:285 length:264 start_codon:yes stop_codon:yes gene_type:complete